MQIYSIILSGFAIFKCFSHQNNYEQSAKMGKSNSNLFDQIKSYFQFYPIWWLELTEDQSNNNYSLNFTINQISILSGLIANQLVQVVILLVSLTVAMYHLGLNCCGDNDELTGEDKINGRQSAKICSVTPDIRRSVRKFRSNFWRDFKIRQTTHRTKNYKKEKKF